MTFEGKAKLFWSETSYIALIETSTSGGSSWIVLLSSSSLFARLNFKLTLKSVA